MDWPTTFNLIFAFINVLFAFFLLRETKLLRQVETEPEISIYLEKTPGVIKLLDIVVKNIGKGAAYKLSFSFDHNSEIVQLDPHRKLFEIGFFQGLEYLAPGQEYRTLLGGNELFRQPPLERLEINVSYQSKDKKQFNDLFYIDPSDYWGITFFNRKDIEDLCNELKNIRSEITHVSQSINNLKQKDNGKGDISKFAEQK